MMPEWRVGIVQVLVTLPEGPGQNVSDEVAQDPQPILWLGERMLASPEKAVSAAAISVYIAVVR